MIALVLLVALPFLAAALTATGLLRLSRVIHEVSEEYAESRMLEPIDENLAAARMALLASDPAMRELAWRELEAAEAGLVAYLSSQYHSVAAEEHQEEEAGRASAMLRRMQTMRGGDAPAWSPEALAREIDALREDFKGLRMAVDRGEADAHKAVGRTRDQTLTLVFGGTAVSTAVCIGLLVWSTRSVNERLRGLHRRLVAHHPGFTEGARGDAESVVTQIEALNSRMIERIEESGRELLRRERMAGIGLLAADVAHEINNPMNAMLGLSELGLASLERGALDEQGQAELRESLGIIRREALRCKGIVERLMAMVRSDRTSGWFDATRLIRETVQVAQAARPDKSICFVTTGGATSVRAFGPADDVRQILLILLINAADAIRPDGRIEVDATQTEDEVWLRVRDNGRGFTESMRQTFFTPFSSFSESRRGAGLGLSIAQALAEGMGASLRPYSDGPGCGSLFVLAIPLPQEQP